MSEHREWLKKTALRALGLFRWMAGVLQAVASLLSGVLVYAATSRTPASACQSMITLFCQTGGLTNDLLAWGMRLFQRSYQLPGAVWSPRPVVTR